MPEEDQQSDPKPKISLAEYLEEVARFCENGYGNRFRSQFEDMQGTSELAMLAAPTAQELAELRRAVAVMTPAEKANAEKLSDEQIATIAQDACVDPGNFAIFINGYAIACKRVS
jgi:DNA-binding IclR family transcriptional regulator